MCHDPFAAPPSLPQTPGNSSTPEFPNFGSSNFYPSGGNNPSWLLPPSYQQPPQVLPPTQPTPGTSKATQPRRSTRVRQQPAPRPGDVYGNSNPKQCHQMDLRTQLPIEGTPVQPSAGNLVALNPASPSDYIDPPIDGPSAGSLSYQDPELILHHLAQEGGAPLISFLLAKAIPSDNEEGKTLPLATSEVRSWQYQDILQLPKAQKEEWKKACHED